MQKIIYNALIIPVDPEMRIIEKGYIIISGDTIKDLGEGIPETVPDVEMIDAEGRWIMPGFINTHTHIPMVLFRGYADDLPLQTWLYEHIFPAENRYMNPENIEIASRWALLEMIRSGTTCFNDMYFFEEVIAREAKRVGIRAVLNDSLIDFPTVSFKTVPEGLKRIEELLVQYQNDPLIHPSVCVHSPYTCSPETLKQAKKLSQKYDTILHIHLSETQSEVEDIKRKRGLYPVEYLDSLGLLDQKTIAAHCVWFDEKEIALFAESGSSMIHCPKSNLKLGSGIADIARYSKAGINVSIGTDGASSNNLQDMVEELRFASLLSKGLHCNPESVTARETIRMATINGARGLGIDHLTGSLEKGKKADMIFIKPGINMLPVYDPYSAIVYAMTASDIDSSMVNGEWVMRGRECVKGVNA